MAASSCTSQSPTGSPADLRIWRDRWKLLRAVEVEELRRLSPAEKLRQLVELHADARAFGLIRDGDDDRLRLDSPWSRLRKRCGV